MEPLRILLALLAFLAGIAALVHGIAVGPLWVGLLGMVLGFLLAYWLWPRRREVDSAWFDVLELLVELPVNALLGLLRLLGRFFRDIDLPGP
jgi:Flp pilus assembly protein TadB